MKIKFLLYIFSVSALISLSSCNDCYTCQAKRDGNLVDFNKECGSKDDKAQMEKEFRKQYPDSVYLVMCN